ncbi:hypothetical protein HID58_026358 [Brassica napus]|uniref:RNase H type-1 domain-containing protein n=3 Tax=Brassica TaxID=3705 RepID=A0ABQ8CQ55_BRANA|nr:hypothetical protein HID58_026358 [Brassica napus]
MNFFYLPRAENGQADALAKYILRNPNHLMFSVTPEISWKLQLYFIGLKREDHVPAIAESLRKEIAVMEDEINTQEELTKKRTGLSKNHKCK